MEDKDKIIVKKIPLYKRVWYSISKIEKYPEMAELGWGKATKYLFLLMLIFAAVFSICTIIDMKKNSEEVYRYLEENIPQCEYNDGILTSENEEKVEIYNNFIANIFGGKIIVDTKTEDENVINEYIESLNSKLGYILTKDKVIVANANKDNIKEENTYKDFFNKYFNENIEEFKKQDILNYVKEKQDSYDFITLYLESTLLYGLAYFIFFSVIIFIITLIIFVISKIMKKKYKILDIFCFTVYGFTLPVFINIIYSLICYFTKTEIPFFEWLFICVASIYSIRAVYKN